MNLIAADSEKCTTIMKYKVQHKITLWLGVNHTFDLTELIQ